jgi:hypothetical protein
MTHYYDKGEHKYPSVTTIIGDCTDKSAPLMQWAANEVVAWIRANCPTIQCSHFRDIYDVKDSDLEAARFAYKDVSQTALDVGSEVHAAIEKYLNLVVGGMDSESAIRLIITRVEMSCQAANSFGAFLTWADEHELKTIATEQTVYGSHWAGTLDWVGFLNGKKYVIDFKSSKNYYKEMAYQVAAYRWAVNAKHVGSYVHGFGYEFPNDGIKGCGILRLDKETGEPEWKDTSRTYEKDLRVFIAMVELYFERHPRIAKGAGR